MNEQMATFGGGCFWCTEAIFQRIKGVNKIVSGYAGGDIENPNYHQVSSGETGHAEAIQLTFDPTIISYEELLEVFFLTHDPTTLNRQGYDVGSQYRSVIFYHTDEQKLAAEKIKLAITERKEYGNPIVTEIVKFDKFYTAEEYHQNYYNENTGAQYCQLVISPKLEKLDKLFKDKLK